MRLRSATILFLLFFLKQNSRAQSSFDEVAFRQMSPRERLDSICFGELAMTDTALFFQKYRPMLAVARAEKDRRAEWALRFQFYARRQWIGLTKAQESSLVAELLTAAKAEKLAVEQVVAEHYETYSKFYEAQISSEACYVATLAGFQKMQDLGLENFTRYDLNRQLFRSARFFFQMGDHENALLFLQKAEPFLTDLSRDGQTSVFIFNHIQAIYEDQKNWPKALEYAKKIIKTLEKAIKSGHLDEKFVRSWRGIASIDIAKIFVEQGRFAEGERQAAEGYALLRSGDGSDGIELRAEFDMLMPLIETKLKLGKNTEAEGHLQRANALAEVLESAKKTDHFLRMRLFELSAKMAEAKGDFSGYRHFSKLAEPLRDSLERRNDARKLEKIKQRLEAKKYSEQIELIESEKQLQKWLKNAAVLILFLVLALGWANFRRIQARRKKAVADLEESQIALEKLTGVFREKADLAESLRLEIERLAGAGERTETLEKLTRRTILTDADWADFRSLFEKAHPDFFQKLKTEHPDLTGAESRLLALEKLNLSDAEMATMLGVSKTTIQQTRYRLKKKMGGDV